jgi:hypothetical protein
MVESGETSIRGVGIYVRKELMAEEVKVITKFQESIYTLQLEWITPSPRGLREKSLIFNPKKQNLDVLNTKFKRKKFLSYC